MEPSLWLGNLITLVVAVLGARWLGLWRYQEPVSRPSGRSRTRPDRAPAARPLEDVVADVRRLGVRFHEEPRGRSFAKLDGIRRAYDDALATCCGELEIEQLLLILPTGPELDLERDRVERRLTQSGVELALEV